MRVFHMLRSIRHYLIFAPMVLVTVGLAPTVQAASHPMDPLSADEIEMAVAVVRAHQDVPTGAFFPVIRLYEMPKPDVLAWQPGTEIPRRAEVTVYGIPGLFRAIVDLDASSVERWEKLEGFPKSGGREFLLVNRVVKEHDEWQEAVRKRGITDLDSVIVMPFSRGYYGTGDRDRWLLRTTPFLVDDSRNLWGRPIEGILAMVDMDEEEVVAFEDTGVIPISPSPAGFTKDRVGELRKAPNKIVYSQPKGASYEVNRHLISWQNWKFHYRFAPQAGLIISNVTYTDGGRERSVAYQMYMSELFVPYMDPGPAWYYKTFFDEGENNLGAMASPIRRGLDCPSNATVFDAVTADAAGKPETVENAIALFEQYDGSPVWRHHDTILSYEESRRSQNLVMRFIATIGNYDYIFDYVFTQSGAITIRAGATGIDSVKGVKSATFADDTSGDDSKYGRFVAKNTVAINHDHFLIYRLDLDVDGPANSLSRDVLKKTRFGEESPRTSGWVLDSQIARQESDAKLNMNMMSPALWRVVNPNKSNPWGHPVSYQIQPSMNAVSLLDPDDWPQKRGMFSYYNLHVTPYEAGERFASGDFPSQSDGSDGLHVWTSRDRPIENTDIVAWYTIGFHHVVRAEDWPVMPTAWHEVTLRPFDFFSRNPALDVP